jgi:hypothetical protein
VLVAAAIIEYHIDEFAGQGLTLDIVKGNGGTLDAVARHTAPMILPSSGERRTAWSSRSAVMRDRSA